MPRHLVEADALNRFGADAEPTLVLARQESFRHRLEQIPGPDEQGDRDGHRDGVEAQAAAQRPVVQTQPHVEHLFDRVVDEAVSLRVRRPQEAAREHRRQADRHQAGHENRDADRHGELMRQPSDDAAHEQHRNENSGERQRHRDDRERDFLRPVVGGAHRRLAHLHVPDDVLQHDDGVVDDEADAERQRHERQVVEAVVEEVHHGERADDRRRQREARDDRRRNVPQEDEDDQDDEADRQDERELDVVNRVADGHRSIEPGVE